jgi:metal-responsive CopG/Arc/MetJ family transcriptional regulator
MNLNIRIELHISEEMNKLLETLIDFYNLKSRQDVIRKIIDKFIAEEKEGLIAWGLI